MMTGTHQCTKCLQSWTTKDEFEKHEDPPTAAEGPWFCDICPKGFATASQFNAHRSHYPHRKSKVNEDKICFVCKEVFESAKAFESHENPPVDLSGIWACSNCPKIFHSRSHLAIHTAHTIHPSPSTPPVSEIRYPPCICLESDPLYDIFTLGHKLECRNPFPDTVEGIVAYNTHVDEQLALQAMEKIQMNAALFASQKDESASLIDDLEWMAIEDFEEEADEDVNDDQCRWDEWVPGK
jgi:hypothetical protein